MREKKTFAVRRESSSGPHSRISERERYHTILGSSTNNLGWCSVDFCECVEGTRPLCRPPDSSSIGAILDAPLLSQVCRSFE